MRADSRLSRVIHVLLHLSETKDPITSEVIAKMLNTNSAVVRRSMSGLKKKFIVGSTKGHKGGWVLAKPLRDISLLDLYEAIEISRLFAIDAGQENSTCLVERIANQSVEDAMEKAKSVFLQHLAKVNLEDLNDEFKQELAFIKKVYENH